MKKPTLLLILTCGAALFAGCSREPESLSIPTGSQVTVQKTDGVPVEGRLVEVSRDRVVVERRTGEKTPVARRDITAIKAADLPRTAAVPLASNDAAQPVDGAAGPGTKYREVTLRAGTVLPVGLETSVGSDTSNVAQEVRGVLRRSITVGGTPVLHAGAAVLGTVTTARRPGKVKGRALIAMRFTEIDTPDGRAPMSSATVSRMAPATKRRDTMQIGIPAGAGAIIGGLVGGGKGAGQGALIGGGAGTAYVLSTRGKDIRLGKGANLAVRLTQPLTVRVRLPS